MGNVAKRIAGSPRTPHMDKLKPFSNIQFGGIYQTDVPGKKFKAIFTQHGEEHVIYFGNSDIADFTKHLNSETKQCYIARNHKDSKQEWCEPMNEKSLTRWILWNRPTVNGGIEDFKERFALA